MADENKKTLIISAVNDTEDAVNEAKRNFAGLHKDVQAMYRQNSRGITVATKELETWAKKSGRTMEEQLKLFEKGGTRWHEWITNADKAGTAVSNAGKKGGQGISMIADLAGGAAGALAGMAVKALTVTAALETMRRGFMSFAEFDTGLRRLQNSIGGTRSEIESFGEMFNDVAMKTGDNVNEISAAFKNFIDKSHIPADQAKKMFPDIAVYAKGANANLMAMSEVAGDAMRIMSIPASDYKKVLESIVHTADDLNVDMNVMAAQGPRTMESMAALGYHGAKGFGEMATYVGIANKATGNTQQSIMIVSNLMEKMLSGDKGFADALNMPVEEMLRNLEKAKSEGSPLAWIMNQFAKSTRQHEILAAAGIKDSRVVRQFQRDILEMGGEIDKTNSAMGGLAKSENILEGPDVAVARLTNSIAMLVKEIGHLLDAFGVTWVIQRFADILGGIAKTAERLISLFESLKRFELPPWWPKTKEEFARNAGDVGISILKSAPIPGAGLVGKGAEKLRDHYYPPDKAGVPLSTEPVQPYENVPLTRGAPSGIEQNYSVGQRPGGAVREKINYVPGRGGVRGGSTDFSARRRDPNIQNASFTGEDNATKIAKAIAKEQGGGYGSSMDAKYLRASYHPGGDGGGFGSSGLNTGVYDQAGPTGGGGTGYGGGTDLARPYEEGQRRGRRGNRTDDSQETPTEQAPGGITGPELQPGTSAPVLPPELGGPQPGEAKPAPNVPGATAPQGPFSPKAVEQRRVNYFQSRGDRPLHQSGVKAALVNTPQGRASAHPEAAADFARMAQAFKDAGAPIKKWGSYNPRKKRWSNDWSSHAYASSWDINDQAHMDPAMQKWVRANPEKFKQILRESNMRQPLSDASMTGGKDAPHIEWTGPGKDDANRPAYAGAGGQAIPGLPKELQTANAAPSAPAEAGRSQSAFAKARQAAINAGIKDPDTAAAIAMYESGNFRRGHGGIYDRSGGTNPFGQTVKRGTPGAIIGADGQPHAVYKNLTEAFEDHKKKWGDRYEDTPEATVRSFTTQKGRGSYNSVNPAWASNVLKIRKREMAKLQAEETRLAAAEAAKPKIAEAEKPKTRSFVPDADNNRKMEDHRDEVKALKGEGDKPKTRPSDDLLMTQRDVNVNLKVNDNSMQFARASMARQADVEMRKARQNSHGDIGVA